jgi:FixJ family two-component response regulator
VPKEFLVAIIDDDAPFRHALVEFLDTFGYKTHGFASVEEFFESNIVGVCDCIITDIHMPGMSGLELMRQLTERGSVSPVIMITARAEPGLEAEAKASGVVCLLRKPFESKDLVDCLERVLKN